MEDLRRVAPACGDKHFHFKGCCVVLCCVVESHILVISERRQILQDESLLHGQAERREAVVGADHHGAHLGPGGAVGRLLAGIASLPLVLCLTGGGGEVDFLLRLPPILLHGPSLHSSSSSLPVLRLPGDWARLVNKVWKQSGRAGSTAAAAAAAIFQSRAELRQRFGLGVCRCPAALSILSLIFPLHLVLLVC